MTTTAELTGAHHRPAPGVAPGPAARGFGVYVHIPYCQVKCPYCDFNSYAQTSWPEGDYARALLAELDRYRDEPPWRGARLATVFFGGGTPSLFAPATIGALLDGFAARVEIASDVEITLEANPGTVERTRLAGFRTAGVNRLSLGIQSFQPDVLRTLGRAHSVDDSRAAIGAARRAGFDNLNLDLIFAVPGQSRGAWAADVSEAVAHAPEHVAAYNLTYEPATPFHAWRARGRLVPAGEEDELWMYEHARAALAAADLAQYEISNFARPGRAARHNRAYWRGRDYLGLGAGAHSYASVPGWGRRWSNERLPDRYLTAVARGGAMVASEELSFDTAAGEFMILGLREIDGIDPLAFGVRFGRPLMEVRPDVARLLEAGLLVTRAGRLALSERGLLVADSIFATLV